MKALIAFFTGKGDEPIYEIDDNVPWSEFPEDMAQPVGLSQSQAQTEVGNALCPSREDLILSQNGAIRALDGDETSFEFSEDLPEKIFQPGWCVFSKTTLIKHSWWERVKMQLGYYWRCWKGGEA